MALNFLVFLLYMSIIILCKSFLILFQSSTPNIEREDSLVEGLDSGSLLNLVRITSGLNGCIPTVFHEDIIFSRDKAFCQLGQKSQKKSCLVIWLSPWDIYRNASKLSL
jgi:hypothetical protein